MSEPTYCLHCQKEGHRTTDCWSTHAVNSPLDRELARLIAAAQAVRVEQAVPKCQTCNGHGMIGGPSYREPDEGGVPCPDCAASSPEPTAVFDDRPMFRSLAEAEHRMRNPPSLQWEDAPSKPERAAYISALDPVVQAIAAGSPDAAPVEPPKHVCGLQGFGALGDVCPACLPAPAQELSDEEIARVAESTKAHMGGGWYLRFARAILAARSTKP